MSERHESGKTSHNRGETMSNQQQGPRFQVRPSARPGGYFWEAFDTQHPRKVMGAPTLDQAQAQARADELNAKTSKHTVRNVVIAVTVGIFVLIGGCTALIGGALSSVDTSTEPSSVATTADNGPTPEPVVTPTNKPSPTQAPPATTQAPKPAPQLTASQEQAVGTARDYLETQSFSRKGLIGQLKFEGFSAKDATFAVDYLKVNWSLQAVGVAKAYLESQHFSRAGLIGQLEYEGFTHAQAVYGVNKAGL